MHTKYLLFIFISLFSFVSCVKEETPVEPAHRTVLIYLAGDNNLSYNMQKNVDMIKEGMLKDGLNGGNLLIYEDYRSRKPHLYQLKLNADTIQQIEIETFSKEQHSATAATLSLVIDKVQKNFPAESYGLVLSSHGTGWLPADINSYLRSFGVDSGGNHIEINDLSSALSKYHFDFILFDACYMACTEVAYALRECTDYLIGSPNEILTNGFPYNEIMIDMFAKEVNVINIGSKFHDFYKHNSGSVSVINSAALDELAAVSQSIFNGKTDDDLFAISTHELQLMESLKRNYHALYDFEDYVNRLATPEQFEVFKQSLDKAVIYKATTPTLFFENPGMALPINKFSGLSIYVFQKDLGKLNEWYKDLDWYKSVF